MDIHATLKGQTGNWINKKSDLHQPESNLPIQSDSEICESTRLRLVGRPVRDTATDDF